MSIERSSKTRIAPTPSGFLHLGNAFNFITTALIAHLEHAKLLLRIDDMDQARYRRAYALDIFDTLDFLEIEIDQGPLHVDDLEQQWSQRNRTGLYKHALLQLRDAGKLFACSCSRTDILNESPDGSYPGTCRNKDLDFDAPNVSWRLKTEGEEPVVMHDWPLASSHTLSLGRELRDMVLRQKDGKPSYQLSSLIDDEHFGVDLIVRGMDLYGSSVAQLYLARELKLEEFGKTRFFHHKLLGGDGEEKLSKSVLKQKERLVESYTVKEIYKDYSTFIGLSSSAGSFSELKTLVTDSRQLT